MNAVTVISRETNEVRFANQDRISKAFVYVKFLGSTGEGPIKRIPLGDVTILENHRFDLLSAYMEYRQQIMMWNLESQSTEERIFGHLTSDIPEKVEKAMLKWYDSNPKPPIPEIISATLYPDGEAPGT